jgi:hypothetical protein
VPTLEGERRGVIKHTMGQREYRRTTNLLIYSAVIYNFTGFIVTEMAFFSAWHHLVVAFWERKTLSVSSFREKSSFSGDIKGDKSGG